MTTAALMTPITRNLANAAKTELLAPAGDRTCLVAAVENGADAVYFGLQGHNARARATNFDPDELPEVMASLHRSGVRGYVTLNTLIFPGELAGVETLVRKVIDAGTDAVIVQDLGLARLIRALTPDLEIHASTQMSITSVEGVRLAQELGCSRVILARELSLREIGKILDESPLPLEVFVHGALCVAYSGQCLTSEALGGRSANRGECAQACRMTYDILRDGEVVDLGDIRYLLSPQDLAAFEVVPDLVRMGVSSLKIEGRLKTPEYVANITRNYRRAIDEAWAGQAAEFTRAEVQDMEMSFSRGFSRGFLDGNNHKVLVRGDYAKKRGIFLGHVTQVVGNRVALNLAAPIKPGDGLVFDGDENAGIPEQGGRVYQVRRAGLAHDETDGLADGPAELAFGRRDLDLRLIQPGQRAWKTDDPELSRRLRASFEGPSRRKIDLDLTVRAVAGEPLAIQGRAANVSISVVAHGPLRPAERLPATTDALRAQCERLGGTAYQLREFVAEIEGGPMVPKSVLNQLRRDLVALLDEQIGAAPTRQVAPESVLPRLRPGIERGVADGPPCLSALCRDTDQAIAAVAAGIRTIYLEYQDIKRYGDAVAAVRRAAPDAAVFLATPRIQKPGEANLSRFLSRQGADGWLVRHAGGLAFCAENELPFVADFSLNAANELAVGLLMSRGARRVTASYDLSFDQLDDLLRAVPPHWLEVVIHQQMPMFHMEHCVFCAFMSPGTDATNCGRPCDVHDVKLRDRVGVEHPLKADVGCRNTLYNAVPQTAAEYLPRLVAGGVRHLRIEFLDDSAEGVSRTIGLYADALAHRRDARTLWRDLKATNRYGVTRGQLAIL